MSELRLEKCEGCSKEGTLIGIKRVASTAWLCRACLKAALKVFDVEP